MNETLPAPRTLLAYWRFVLWGGVAGLLLLPAVAMRFTTEVNWTATDFLFAGVVLGGAGAAFEVVMMTLKTPLFRAIGGLAILGLVMLVWASAVSSVF